MKKFCLIVVLIAAIASPGFSAAEEFSSKIIHFGMIVSDLDKSLAFYKDVVGFIQDPARKSFDVDAKFGKSSGLTDGLALHVEVLKLGVGEDATQLKLMTFGDKPTKKKNEYISSTAGLQYMTIMVENLTPIVERIKKAKIKLLGETPIPLGDRHFVLIQDPDGTFVELIGPMK